MAFLGILGILGRFFLCYSSEAKRQRLFELDDTYWKDEDRIVEKLFMQKHLKTLSTNYLPSSSRISALTSTSAT